MQPGEDESRDKHHQGCDNDNDASRITKTRRTIRDARRRHPNPTATEQTQASSPAPANDPLASKHSISNSETPTTPTPTGYPNDSSTRPGDVFQMIITRRLKEHYTAPQAAAFQPQTNKGNVNNGGRWQQQQKHLSISLAILREHHHPTDDAVFWEHLTPTHPTITTTSMTRWA